MGSLIFPQLNASPRTLALPPSPVGFVTTFDTKKGFSSVFWTLFGFSHFLCSHRRCAGRSDGHAHGAGKILMTHAQAVPRVDCFQRCQVSAQHHCVIDGFQKSVFCCRCCSVQSRCAQIAGIKEGDLDRFGGDTEDDYSLAAWLDKGPDVNAKNAELALPPHEPQPPSPLIRFQWLHSFAPGGSRGSHRRGDVASQSWR